VSSVLVLFVDVASLAWSGVGWNDAAMGHPSMMDNPTCEGREEDVTDGVC